MSDDPRIMATLIVVAVFCGLYAIGGLLSTAATGRPGIGAVGKAALICAIAIIAAGKVGA